MKKVTYILLLFFLSNALFSQNNIIYLEIYDFQNIEEIKGDLKGIYEYTIPIRNKKNNDIIDYYKFIINCDGDKSFSENGIEFSIDKKKILTIENIMKKNSCEIHEFFSMNQLHLLIKDNSSSKYKRWIFMYLGTSRNISTTKLKSKI